MGDLGRARLRIDDAFYAAHRYDAQSGGEKEIQRTMLELLNQLDGFESRGDVKVRSVCPEILASSEKGGNLRVRGIVRCLVGSF